MGAKYDKRISSETVTTGAASALSGAVPTGATHAWLVCSALAWIKHDGTAAPTAVAAAADNQLITSTPVRIPVTPGAKIAHIQESAAAKVCITYVNGQDLPLG